jgi:serine/threonine protein kinase/WD40 repeat protein
MNHRCPKCGCELVRASNEGLGANTVTRSLLVCSQCGAATIDSDSTADPETLSFDPPDPDEQIAHFTLRHRLGSGGFGEVWHATDQKLGRSVALKLSKSRRRDTFSLVFEAQTAASLRHPHIVSVHEVGEANGQVYIASDLIEGMTLGDFLSAGKPQLGRAIQILIPICRALHFAHTHGVYHRDVKPANILLDHAGQPYVTDFGLAKRANDTSSSSDGRMIGTVRYMSPEQAVGNIGETDGRSDIYALGVTFFEMLTGETPFRGNAQALLHQKAFDDPPSPRLLDPSIPKDLETICLKCLERDPAKRFATAAKLADELERFAANEPILSRPISRMERTWRWCQKRPAISGLVAGLFISLVTGLLGVSYFWRSSLINETAAQESLYRSWLNMAGIHLRRGDSQGVRETLSRVEKDPALAKLIGFEWNFYHTLMKPLVLVGDLGMPVVDVAITFDGDYCAATGGENDIYVWSVQERKLTRVLTSEGASFQTIDFSPVNAHLASGSLDGYVRIYDPLAGSNMIRQLRHGPQVTQVRYSPDGKLVAASGKTGAVRVWNVADASLVAELPTGRKVPSTTEVIRYSPDSTLLYVASADGFVREWDLKAIKQLSNEVVPTPKAEYDLQIRPLTAFCISSDGQFLTGGNFFGTVATLSSADGSLITHATRWGRMDDMEPFDGNDLIAIATNDGLMHIFNRKTGNDSQAIHTHTLSAEKLSQSRNRKVLVFGSGDGAVSVIKVADLIRPATLWHEDQVPVRSIDFAGPAEKVLAAYENSELRLWNTEAGTYQRLIEPAKGS